MMKHKITNEISLKTKLVLLFVILFILDIVLFAPTFLFISLAVLLLVEYLIQVAQTLNWSNRFKDFENFDSTSFRHIVSTDTKILILIFIIIFNYIFFLESLNTHNSFFSQFFNFSYNINIFFNTLEELEKVVSFGNIYSLSLFLNENERFFSIFMIKIFTFIIVIQAIHYNVMLQNAMGIKSDNYNIPLHNLISKIIKKSKKTRGSHFDKYSCRK